jgi:hypothetical protein
MNILRKNINSFIKINGKKSFSLYSYAPITDSDYSLVPFAYVITITSILWGAESVNKVKIVESTLNNYIYDLYLKCLQSNEKKCCLEFKEYLNDVFYKKNKSQQFNVKFENYENN